MSLVTNWITKIPRLKNSKVARFSYKAEAYANDDIEGVENYDYSRDMNVPLATHTDFDPAMLSIGARANLSSVPKNGLNHFFGRVSYNLNKVIDFLDDLLTDFVSFTEVLYLSSATALTTYANGTTKRLLNTSDGIIDVTLPLGEAYNGSQIIKLEPFKLLVILKVGTVWINAGSGDGTAVDTLPAASAVYKDKILQYIGATDEDYTSGWFYKCVETSPSVYEWQDIQVQDTPSNIITGFYENGKLWKGTNAEYLALDASIRTNDAITFIVTDIESDVPQLISDSTISAETTWSSYQIEKLTKEIRSSVNFTLDTFTDGTRVRLVNTHATNTITCTLPTGQTMNGQTSFTIAPDTLLEFELVGATWSYAGKSQLYNSFGYVNGWQNFGADSKFYYQYNFDTVCIHCYEWYGYNATSPICGIIPLGLRPIERIGFSGANLTAGEQVAAVRGSISPLGNIIIYQQTSIYKLNFTVTYKYR